MPNREDGESWLDLLEALATLVDSRPGFMVLLFFAVLIIILALPGGVLTSWLRLRTTRAELEHQKEKDVIPLMASLTERWENAAAEAARGKKKA